MPKDCYWVSTSVETHWRCWHFAVSLEFALPNLSMRTAAQHLQHSNHAATLDPKGLHGAATKFKAVQGPTRTFCQCLCTAAGSVTFALIMWTHLDHMSKVAVKKSTKVYKNYLNLIDFRQESLILGGPLLECPHIASFSRLLPCCRVLQLHENDTSLQQGCRSQQISRSMHGSPGRKSPFQVRRKPSAPGHRPVPC